MPPREIRLDDGDTDKIYFAGDTIAFVFEYFPADTVLRVSFELNAMDEEGYSPHEVIEGLVWGVGGWHIDITTDEHGWARLEGIIEEDLPFAEARIVVYWDIYSDSFGEELIFVGLPLTFGGLHINFDEIDDLYDTDNRAKIYLPGVGAILFSNTFDDGVEADDSSLYFDPAEFFYVEEEDILVIPVFHFSSYEFTLADEESEIPVTGSGIYWLLLLGMVPWAPVYGQSGDNLPNSEIPKSPVRRALGFVHIPVAGISVHSDEYICVEVYLHVV